MQETRATNNFSICYKTTESQMQALHYKITKKCRQISIPPSSDTPYLSVSCLSPTHAPCFSLRELNPKSHSLEGTLHHNPVFYGQPPREMEFPQDPHSCVLFSSQLRYTHHVPGQNWFDFVSQRSGLLIILHNVAYAAYSCFISISLSLNVKCHSESSLLEAVNKISSIKII